MTKGSFCESCSSTYFSVWLRRRRLPNHAGFLETVRIQVCTTKNEYKCVMSTKNNRCLPPWRPLSPIAQFSVAISEIQMNCWHFDTGQFFMLLAICPLLKSIPSQRMSDLKFGRKRIVSLNFSEPYNAQTAIAMIMFWAVCIEMFYMENSSLIVKSMCQKNKYQNKHSRTAVPRRSSVEIRLWKTVSMGNRLCQLKDIGKISHLPAELNLRGVC